MKTFSLGTFLGGIAVGIVVTGGWFLSRENHMHMQQSDNDSAAATTTTNVLIPTTVDSGAVSVLNQGAGLSVSVASVTVPPPGVWVAVRELNGTDLGNVLGALFVSGPRSDVTIPLLRQTEPNETYAIELYRDNGDHTFNLSSDSVYVDFGTSEPVIQYFKTTSGS